MFAVVAGVSGLAMATPSWTTGSCAPADWQALDGNVLLNVTGTSAAQGVSSFASMDLGVLTDGQVPTSAPDKSGIFGFRVNDTISWAFAAPRTLEQVRISTCYLTGAAYDGVHIAKVDVLTSSGWEQIAGEVEYKGESAAGKINYAVLDNGDDPVAQGVSGLKVTFGSCETGYANYYAEIEAVGASGAVGPSLGAVTVSPGKTKASLSGSVAEAGTDATACDVYLAIGEAAAVKIAEGVTSAFSYTVENLTPNTTYAYALSVSNNAATVMGTVKNGEFTTLPADAATASWTKGTFMPADWQPLVGNVLANVKGTMVVNTPNGYGSNDLGVLSDGEVPSAAGKSWIVGVMPNAEIVWTLPEPVTLEQVRISSCYLESPAFSGVNIASIKVKCSGSDAWVEIAGSSSGKIVGDGSTKNIVCATLSDAENGALAQNVTALKIVSGPAVYINANYYAEIEAVGSTGSDDPTPVQGVVFTFE